MTALSCVQHCIIPRRTPVSECCFQFVEATLVATAECERELVWCVLCSEILGDEAASNAGCTPDDEIVLPVSVGHGYRLQLVIHGLNCWVNYPFRWGGCHGTFDSCSSSSPVVVHEKH